jgi:transposase
MRAQAQAGEIELAYLDEVGFSQVPPNRSAWTLRGHRHIIDAPRGKQLNVMAALLSRGHVFNAKVWCTYNGELFTAFLALLRQHVGRPLTVILDNARIHTAKAIQPYLELLKTQGVTLYFLPPYSPELNRMEKLWHLMKHSWLSLKRRDIEALEKDVGHILDNFGVDYKMSF